MEYECPSSSVPSRIWSVLDLFWHCYQKVPGMAGWEVHRTHLPEVGGVSDQDHWTLWAFRILGDAFYQVESEHKDEPESMSHEQLKKKHGLS